MISLDLTPPHLASPGPLLTRFSLCVPTQQHAEEAQLERRELLKAMRLLQEEKQQLHEEQKRLAREREQERETCCLLRTHNQVRAPQTGTISAFPPRGGGANDITVTHILFKILPTVS